MIETTILLRDRSEWRPGLSWDDLVQELDETLQIPGMPNLWWMPIQTRIEMLTTGVRTPLAVQISETTSPPSSGPRWPSRPRSTR
jgi:Cu(I)/Ag(I) efflux system membrane protein CusA/SilA